MLSLALLFATLAPDDTLADQIAHCGIARDQISARYESGLEDDVAVIATPSASLTSDHLACLVGLAMSGRLFAFADPAAQKRFDPLIQASERKSAEIEGRQWLADHGLLEKLPVFDPKHQSLAQFGLALEALCGVAPGTRLRAHGNTMLEFMPPDDPNMSEAELTQFQCIISATLAGNPDPSIFTVGFIGNEQRGTK